MVVLVIKLITTLQAGYLLCDFKGSHSSLLLQHISLNHPVGDGNNEQYDKESEESAEL